MKVLRLYLHDPILRFRARELLLLALRECAAAVVGELRARDVSEAGLLASGEVSRGVIAELTRMVDARESAALWAKRLEVALDLYERAYERVTIDLSREALQVRREEDAMPPPPAPHSMQRFLTLLAETPMVEGEDPDMWIRRATSQREVA